MMIALILHSQAYIEAGGEVSQETLLNNASFTDYETEIDRIKKEEGASDFERVKSVGVADESEDSGQ